MESNLINPNPKIFKKKKISRRRHQINDDKETNDYLSKFLLDSNYKSIYQSHTDTYYYQYNNTMSQVSGDPIKANDPIEVDSLSDMDEETSSDVSESRSSLLDMHKVDTLIYETKTEKNTPLFSSLAHLSPKEWHDDDDDDANTKHMVNDMNDKENKIRLIKMTSSSNDEESIDSLEVFELLRNICDPEHPLSLEQLNVVQHELVEVNDQENHIKICFTPTITHCSMATLIGLCIRVKLLQSLPNRFKIDIYVTPGSHQSEKAVNKQLNDKERIAAALENSKLLSVVNKCIDNTDV